MFGHIAVVGALALVGSGCQTNLEILHLQDGTYHFASMFATYQKISILVERLGQSFASVRYGVGYFSDKAMPFSGFGSTWGRWQGIVEDSCYQLAQPLTDKGALVAEALVRTPTMSGNDEADAQLEALLRGLVDPNVGWSNDSTLKLAVLVTNGFTHGNGDALKNIKTWNDNYGKSTEGWFVNQLHWDYQQSYCEWVELRESPTNETRLAELDAVFLPDEWPHALYAFPYNGAQLSSTACHQVEYPHLVRAEIPPPDIEAINRLNIHPIVVALAPYSDYQLANLNATECDEDYDCWHYRSTKNQYAFRYCPDVDPLDLNFYVQCIEAHYSDVLASTFDEFHVVGLDTDIPAEDLLVQIEEAIDAVARRVVGCGMYTTTTPAPAPLTAPSEVCHPSPYCIN